MRQQLSSMHDDVATRLRDRIFSGDLSPGSFLDETQLCEQLSISRTPLREALKVLACEGLVRHEPRRGSFVSEVTDADLEEIFPVIALLEGRSAFEAAQKATDADIAVLETLHERLEHEAAQGDITAYYAANYAIHEALITLANNHWLAQVTDDLRKIVKLARRQGLQAPQRMASSLREHLAIFAAIKARDGAGAEAAMKTHLLRQLEVLRALPKAQIKVSL
ncbi:MAG: GntR family transcriptional regulator [Cytophagales bacterium]|nr:GntR family transcriptional regulator [Cytophagales bacterium]